MDTFKVDFSASFDRQLVKAVLPKLHRLRNAIDSDMNRDVPVLSGDLKRSLFCKLNPTTGSITGGATEDYAADVEYGHTTPSGTQVSAQPYIRPAFNKRRGEIR